MSLYHVGQRLVVDVNAAEAYPYDTAAFVSAATIDASKAAPGFNAGADVDFPLSKHLGLDAIARYGRASLTFATTGGAIEVHAGGAQVGGGLRICF